MLPSISQSLVSSTSGAAVTAGSLLSGAAPAAVAPKGGSTITAALATVDRLVGAAAKAGLSAAAAATKAPKPKASGAGYAKSTSKAKSSKTSTSKSAAAKKAGPLAFLDDPKLSIEDKLMRLLAHLNDKWDKEIDKKLKELKGAAGGDPASPVAPAAKKKKGGILGSLGAVASVAKSFFPAVGVALDVLQSPAARAVLSKLGGPVLAAAATAVGFPQLAPLALRYGPGLVDLAAGIASSVGNEAASAAAPAGASGGGSSTAAGGKTDGDGLSSDRKAQLKLMEIQRVFDQQREMFSLVSNMLRSGHDTRMAVIQNVR